MLNTHHCIVGACHPLRFKAMLFCLLLLGLAPLSWAQDQNASEGILNQEVLEDTALAALAGTWRPDNSDARCLLLPKAVQQLQCEDAFWNYFSMLEDNQQLMLDMDDCFIKTVTTAQECLEHPNRFQWGWQDGCLYAELTMRDHCIERFSTPVQAGPVLIEESGDQSVR